MRGAGIRVWMVAVFLAGFASGMGGAPPARTWHYQLLPGSYLIKDCPPCAGPTFLEPMRGSFDLRLEDENPISSRYAIENLSFTAGSIPERTYQIAGLGTYTVGGEVALVQDMTLQVQIDDGFTNRLCFFTNTTPVVERLWPMIEATLVQTNGTFTQVYHLHLFAAPFHELWFSTVSAMTPGNWSPPTNLVSAGDLLSSAGRVVKRNRELTQRLGLTGLVPDLGLDAVDMLPGGEMAFSLQQDAFSVTLGQLQDGDLLSSRGRILHRNQELTAAFQQMPAAPDAGLDAVQFGDDGEVYFSIETNFFSEVLARRIGEGDLLSSQGRIVKSNQQLLTGFHPADPRPDYGLDAFHVWPSGEVWFSVEIGFQSERFETTYGPGDLLSDQGYVVARNLELVGPFQPVEDLADFGLDALFVITDDAPPAPAPRFTRIYRPETPGSVSLEWTGQGRVWQVFGASNVAGPWQPVSPILPDLFFEQTSAPTNQFFYRLRQW